MAKQVKSPVTSHQLSWMDDEFGWLTLLNGTQIAGYLYFKKDGDPLMVPHLDSDESIVFSIHISHLELMLGILRSDHPLQVRFFDPQSEGVNPTAFIESVSAALESNRAVTFFRTLEGTKNS